MTPQSLKIAILAASGVSENEMTAIQRTLGAARTRAIVISPESGLIHSWAEGTWGHCYPADAKIEVSLGSDYDFLILPGGQRHVDKLMMNPHTKRFVSAFFAMSKPVAAFADAETILSGNGFAGENALMLKYECAETLAAACVAMMAHMEAHAASRMDDIAAAA